MHLWVFQKAEIAWAVSASAISAFWKTHKCKLIPNWTRKTVWLLINNTNMKKFAREKCRKMFLEAIFFALEKTFFRVSVQNCCHCFTWSWSTCTMCYLHWCYTFCIGVKLFALVLHLNSTSLSQAEMSNFFMRTI